MSPEEKRILQLSEENVLLNQKYEAVKEQLSQIESQQQASRKRKVRWAVKIASWWGGKDLKNSTIDLYNELPAPSKATTGNFLGSLADRFTKLTLFGLLLSLIPFILLLSQVVLLYIQNDKIESQNELFKKQNTKIDIQNEKINKQVYLEEASRRNNLVLFMDNILEKVNTEITETKKTLSEPLIGRISALSQGFQPFRFLEDSALTEEPFSPERGLLLLALANSGIDTATLDIIYSKTTFKQAYLKEAKMNSLYLKKIRLSEANLQKAVFSGSDLSEANLSKTNLFQTSLFRVNLSQANLCEVNLGHAHLDESDLRNTKFCMANLKGANLREADLRGASFSGIWAKGAIVNHPEGTENKSMDLRDAIFINTDLRNSTFSGADIRKAKFEGADLRNAVFEGVDLRKAKFEGANLKGVDFIDSNLSETIGLTYEPKYMTKNKDAIYQLIKHCKCL